MLLVVGLLRISPGGKDLVMMLRVLRRLPGNHSARRKAIMLDVLLLLLLLLWTLAG